MIFDLLALAWLSRSSIDPVVAAKRGVRFVRAVAVPLPKTPAEVIERLEKAVKREFNDE